ncbi:hypothetical protein IEQ34_005133 [Dendrobium chrysotoxum]|uniref:Crossover junction endonuclease MUS81 n=1 Tax=Dendrobium chrysotoxum TaxID=161865 RepID=A0AAV7GT29_DENCH|nr:hypothetical protein IEQ34_005133 [Dendrobium chrysotoxum]
MGEVLGYGGGADFGWSWGEGGGLKEEGEGQLEKRRKKMVEEEGHEPGRFLRLVGILCFTTEILEGFDVQRTSGFADTVRRYGFLSLSIKKYYSAQFSTQNARSQGACPIFNEFVKRCQDLEKITVSDVFSLQLMQVPLVTEDIALAVIDLYPTVLALARAYSLLVGTLPCCLWSCLEGDIRAQEEMLKNQNKTISSGASKNIFKLIWGS